MSKFALKQSDTAVSPVIGIMLMLIVTIIIAAVVSGFASGLVGGQQKAPQASIQATLYPTEGTIIFQHMGGDPFDLNSIYLTLQSKDTSTQINTTTTSLYKKFEKMGDSSSTKINPGDQIILEAKSVSTYAGTTNINFGSFSLQSGVSNSWIISDKQSKGEICRGAFSEF